MKFTTKCVHGSNKKYDNTGAVSVPIFQTSTFLHHGVEQSTGFDYSRLQNPTREYLENVIANLEEGIDALAFSSGMAAETAFMELFSPGDRLIASDDLYGGSIRLFQHISKKNGVEVTLSDTGDIAALENAICEKTKAIFVETPTNPMMQVTDIAAVAEITRKRGIILAVDNTFLTPYFQRPLALGADIVVHSGTKYLGGHNDTLAGFLVTNSQDLSEKLRFIHKTTGACLSPFDSWLMIRGIKTLAVRMRQQEKTAIKLAQWLLSHPKVNAVFYCGLPNSLGYEICKKQASGFGGMISFETDTEETARRILENVNLIGFAESLGGTETLITYPFLQTHADVPENHRRAKGINERLLRISVGLEDAEDLIADLQQALDT
ncbi:MAG: PLP-dependent aspartate aminotransferase family protein [Defluviitaleaceae bacterium]|nr:PLP-dependent aspartate aminotransferase family protein [Defluviitaleaceae bacterium]MCL2263634.1 PLP-dependent aspartate aminotransferase family protein [Defluviitaleaceae bacterium]